MTPQIMVSVIIPVYNVGEYVRKSIESALTQTLTDIEVIVIDDGSTDKSRDIVDEYRDERLIIRHKPNGGVSSARQLGYSLASGRYVLYLDADDYLSPDALEKMVFVAENKGADYVVGDFIIDWGNGRLVSRQFKDFKVADNIEFVRYCLTENDFYYTGRLFRKSFLDLLSINIPNDITYGEDNLAVTQIAMQLSIAAKLNHPILYYVQRFDSVTNKLKPKDLDKRAKAIRQMVSLLTDWGEYKSIKSELNLFISRELYSAIVLGYQSEEFNYHYCLTRSVWSGLSAKQLIVLLSYSIFPKTTLHFFRKRHVSREKDIHSGI